jgi:anaerobic magnesium-protoporphyrin IX monomethyl ester cyclase
VPFTIQLRADLVSVRMAEALRNAGCREAWIGAESGSQKVLDAMNKGTRVRENIHARRLLGEAGIRVGFFLQLGYLGEELEDILATRRLVEEARPDDVGVSVSYPLPGTKFYEAVKQQMGEKRHWQESNDLDMMFAGTYRSEFYRAVRNLLHDQVTHPDSPDIARRWDELCAGERDYRQQLDEFDASLDQPVGGLQSAAAFR